MSRVQLYDSRGYPLDDPDGQRNEQIRNMSRYGVVFTISYTQPYEMATYFRAYETASGRMEQYYATYTTSSSRGLLREFREAVIRTAEEEYDLRTEDSASGENVLNNLAADDPGQVGTERQREHARRLLSGGERLRFGVGSYEKAFKLIGELAGARPGMEFAVTEGESTHAGPMSTYDLVVEKGSYTGLVPLGDTESLMNPEPAGDEPPSGAEAYLELAKDVGFGVAVAVLLVVAYASVAYLVWLPPGFVPIDQQTHALPGTGYVPGTHNATIDVVDAGGNRTVRVTGYSPADALSLQFVNESNSTTVVASRTLNATESGRIDQNESVPANATHARVQYKGWLPWAVEEKNLSAASESASSGSTTTSTATPTATATSEATTTTSTTTTTTTSTATTTTSTATTNATPTTAPTATGNDSTTTGNDSTTTGNGTAAAQSLIRAPATRRV